MESTLKYEILDYLRSGNARSKEYNQRIIKSWGNEGAEILKQIMDGKMEVENPRIRLRSFFVLNQMIDPKEFKQMVSELIIKGQDQRLRFQAFSALATASAKEAATLAPELLEEVEVNPAIALGAARVLAQVQGKEALPAIKKLSERILKMAEGNVNSPSYISLNLLMDDLQGRRMEEKEVRIKEV